MKTEYLRQRDSLMVDMTIDLRPEHVRGQKLPRHEVNTSLDNLEMIFAAILAKSE